MTIHEPPFFRNVPAPALEEYYPLNEPSIGTPYPQGFALRGAGAIILEATAVSPNGRFTPECPGIWSDTHIPPMKRIVDFVHGQGAAIGIQLGHAGRKASTLAPWVQARRKKAGRAGSERVVARDEEGGWTKDVVAASDIPFSDAHPKPRAMTEQDIDELVQSYVDAVERREKIGFDFIETHGAHGYLLHSFYSPLSNNPTDWAEGSEKDEKTEEWKSWGIEQTVELAKELKMPGVDVIDTSSGGNWAKQSIPVGPGYQVQLAERVKGQVPDVVVENLGLITSPQQAEKVLQDSQAEVVLLARELLRHADFSIYAAQELGVVVKPANQYERAWMRMMKPRAE
ncbi:hypothetical protein FRC06_001934 [Ceratobasidium sp. 370]|nr:hypothetical protein FRC06_001934 [Ceratobasidium sp. 370]